MVCAVRGVRDSSTFYTGEKWRMVIRRWPVYKISPASRRQAITVHAPGARCKIPRSRPDGRKLHQETPDDKGRLEHGTHRNHRRESAMKIRMLKYVNGKVNGVHMGPYLDGGEYDLDRERAELFIGSAMAEEVIPVPVEDDEETVTIQRIESDKPKRVRGGGKGPTTSSSVTAWR